MEAGDLWEWESLNDSPRIGEIQGPPFNFPDSISEVLNYWHILRVTGTHSPTTRADGFLYFSHNDFSRERFMDRGAEDLDIARKTVSNWLDEFVEAGLLQERVGYRGGENRDQNYYEPTPEGTVMEQGLDKLEQYLAGKEPVTEEEKKRAALWGLKEWFNLGFDVEDLNPEEYVETLNLSPGLHENISEGINHRRSRNEAIKIINDLKEDYLQVIGTFTNHPEDEARELVDECDSIDLTGSGARTYMKRAEQDRGIVRRRGESYVLTTKGKAAIATFLYQAGEMERVREARDTVRLLENVQGTDFEEDFYNFLDIDSRTADYCRQMGVTIDPFLAE